MDVRVGQHFISQKAVNDDDLRGNTLAINVHAFYGISTSDNAPLVNLNWPWLVPDIRQIIATIQREI